MTNLTYPMLYIAKEKGDTQKESSQKLGISPQRYQLKKWQSVFHITRG